MNKQRIVCFDVNRVMQLANDPHPYVSDVARKVVDYITDRMALLDDQASIQLQLDALMAWV